ncbi:tRNA-intron lyase [Candidatus Micrarchaeota archaeon CG11_big_fil_rev_8_21_14_0_20_47_5]|nr:MAG: tRNA-intron lyase [Candidatus Micrarchaeota archaeon CG1_02_47_40]PIN84003.1 MAG: tRNA-intron lyase [Candidatus Micrarchaeota archaeon CG11_big_fil_rev_8_21_14_0_20_47_5]
MAVQIDIDRKTCEITCAHPESVSSLVNGHYGIMKKGVIYLYPEEALYLADIRNAKCYDKAGNVFHFNDLASLFPQKKLMARYFTFKDWRDRGLIARPAHELPAGVNFGRNPVKKYPKGKFQMDRYSLHGAFYEDDLVCIIDDSAVAKDLYERYWLGQFASYKAEQRGNIGKLDMYETLFMVRNCRLSIRGADEKKLMSEAKKRRKDFPALYEVYEDWRIRGFVLKTGFKFGTHFRLYFPGASPTRNTDEWIHSKHVIHVFPRNSRLLISEWARAIRVAHSVKKTFILAIPGKEEKWEGKLEVDLDFALYHRKGGDIENPKDGKPKYLMLSLSEEEEIGGAELAKAIVKCKEVGLELLLAIADRETSVTYYLIKRIELPGSNYEYYEIEWVQP